MPLFDPKVHLFENSLLKILAQLNWCMNMREKKQKFIITALFHSHILYGILVYVKTLEIHFSITLYQISLFMDDFSEEKFKYFKETRTKVNLNGRATKQGVLVEGVIAGGRATKQGM